MTTTERIINNIRTGYQMNAIAYSSRSINKALKDPTLTAEERGKLEAFLNEAKALEAQQPPTTAQQIRADLKAAGFKLSDISVKSSFPGYEEVVTVEIKNVFISLETVEKIARKYHEVAYDERCQEVLAGGNTFVRVRYNYESENAAISGLLPFASEIIDKNLTAYPFPNGVLLHICADYLGFNFWNDETNTRKFVERSDWKAEYLPRAVAHALFNLGARPTTNPNAPASDPDPTVEEIKRFEVGKIYQTRSICNNECIISITVTARTDKTITVIEHGETKRLRINEASTEYRKAETVYPWGHYSMAPMISADMTADPEPPAPTNRPKRHAAPSWVGVKMTAYPRDTKAAASEPPKSKNPDFVGRKMIITIGERSARPA